MTDKEIKSQEDITSQEIAAGNVSQEATTPPSGQKQVVTTPDADPNPAPTTQTTGQPATATVTTGQGQQPADTTGNPAENPDNYTFTEEEMNAMDSTFLPNGGVAEDGVSTSELYNWSNPGTTIYKVLADPGNENTTGAILSDYLKWAYHNNQPVDYFAVNDAIRNKDISKSPAENAKELKKKENKERWDKVGNFLLHLGNVIGNVAGGGMGAVKLEDPVQYTERQRMLKEKTEQLQNSYNQSIFAQMANQYKDLRKADMDKRRQDRLDKETQIRQEKNDAYRMYQESLASKNEAMTAYYKAKAEALEEGLPLELALKRAKAAKEEAQARLANTKANAGGFAPQRPVQAKETTTTTTKVDSLGDKTTTTTTKRTGPVGNGNQNTPPSRRDNSNSSNTPPSRRK